MQNYDVAVKATNTSINSQGSAMQENARYLESAQAKVNKLKVAWEELALSSGNTVFVDMITMITSDLRYLINSIDALISLDFSKGNLIAGFTMLAGLTGGLTTLMNGGIRNMVFSDNYVEQLQEKLSGVTGAYQEATKKANANRLAQQNAIPIGNQSITMMDKLKGSAHATAGGFRVAGAAVGGFVKTVGAAVATSIGIGVVIGAVTMAVGALITQFTKYRAEIAKKKQEQKELIKAYGDNVETIDMLADRYDALQSNTNRSAEETELMYSTAKSLGGYLPELVTHVDELGRTHLTSATSAKEYVNTLKEMQQLAAMEKLDKNSDSLVENKEKIEEATKAYQKLLEKRKQSDLEYAQDREMSQGLVSDAAIYSVGSDNTAEARKKDRADEIESERELKQAKMSSLKLTRERIGLEVRASDEFSKLNGEQQKFIENMTANIDEDVISKILKNAESAEDIFIETDKIKEEIIEIIKLVSDLPSFDKTLFEGMSGNAKGTKYRETLDEYVSAMEEIRSKQKTLLTDNGVATSNGLVGQALMEYQALDSMYRQIGSSGQVVVNSAQQQGVAISDTTVKLFEQVESLDENRKASINAVASMSELEAANSEVAGAVSEATNAIDDLGSALGYADGSFRSSMETVSTYNDILAKNAEGYTYTVDEMVNLIDKNPDLVRAFEVQNGVVSLNTGVVEELREVQRLQFLEKLKQTQESMLSDALGAQMFARYSGDKIKSIKTVADAEKELVRVKKEAALEVARIEGAVASIDKDDPNYGRQMYASDLAARMKAQIESDTRAIQDSLDNIEQFGKNAEKIGAAIVTPSRDLYNANKAAAESNKKVTETEKNKQDTISNSIYITNKYTEAIDKATLASEKQARVKNKYAKGSKVYEKALQLEIKALEKQKKVTQDYINVLSNANKKKQIIAGTGIHSTTTPVITNSQGGIISSGSAQKSYDISSSPAFKKTGSKKLSGWSGINSAYGIVRTINGKTWKHEGIDVAGRKGQRLDSNVNGTVFYTGGRNASLGIPSQYGKTVVIQDTRGTYHIYAHLNYISVKKGQKIGVGEQIGTVGNTGNTTGAHLHYEQRSAMGKWGQNLLNPTRAVKSAVSSRQNTYTYSSGGVSVSAAKSSSKSSSRSTIRANQGVGAFKGKEHLFNKYGQKYGVDPALALAIAHWETGNGTSKGVKQYNNPGGLMSPSSNWSKQTVFKSLDAGIEAMISNLQRNYISKGLKTIEQIQKKYAPNGVANDPNNLNQYWVNGVTSMYKKISTTKSSSSPVSSGSSNSDIDKAKAIAEKQRLAAEKAQNLQEQRAEEERRRKELFDLEESRQDLLLDYLNIRADRYKEMYDRYSKDRDFITTSMASSTEATQKSLEGLIKLQGNAKLKRKAVELEILRIEKDKKTSLYKDLSYARRAEINARLSDLKRMLKQEQLEERSAAMEIARERAEIRNKLVDNQMRYIERSRNFAGRQINAITGDDNSDKAKRYELTVKQEMAERKLWDIKKRQLEAEREIMWTIRRRFGADSKEFAQQLEFVERYSDELMQLEDSINSLNEQQADMLAGFSDDVIQKIKDAIQSQKEAELKSIDEIQEKRQKDIEHERNARANLHKARLKELDEEREKMTKYFDERLKLLDEEQENRSHEKQMEEFAKKEKEIRSSLNRISADDSFEAKAKRKELTKELDELLASKEDYLYDRNLEKKREAIEEERKSYEESNEEKLKDEEKLFEEFEESMDRREKAEEELYDKIRENIEKHYDDILNNEKKWAEIREEMLTGNFDNVKGMAESILNESSAALGSIYANLGKTYGDILKDMTYVFDDAKFMGVSMSDSLLESFKNLSEGKSFVSLGEVIQNNIIDSLKESLDLIEKIKDFDFDTESKNPNENDDLQTSEPTSPYKMYAKQTGAGRGVNLYGSADAKSKVLGSLAEGRAYEVVERGAEFSKVKMSNGTSGWVKNTELKEEKEFSKWGLGYNNDIYQQYIKAKAPVDNLLKEYGVNSDLHSERMRKIQYGSGKTLYNRMVEGSLGRITGLRRDAQLKYYTEFEASKTNEEREAAIKRYIKTMKTLNDDVVRAQNEFDAMYKSIQGNTTIKKEAKTTSDAALYKDPYASSEGIVGQIKKGTKIKILYDRGYMYEVQYGDKKGYVNKNYVGSFASGGWYTGNFEGGMPATLHKKELVLNQEQTKNMLKTVEFTDSMIAPLRSLIGKLQSVKGGNTSPSIHIDNINNDFSNNEIKDGKDASKTFMEETMNMINNKFGKR